MTALEERKKLRKKIKEGLEGTGVYVYNHRFLFPNVGERIIAQLQLAQQMGVHLQQLGQEQEAEEQQKQHTESEIKQMIKALDQHARDLLKQAQQQRKRFENIQKEAFITSKDTKDIDEKITGIEQLIGQLKSIQIKQQIASTVNAIKKLLDGIKSDIKLEKRLGRREARLLNLFIQSHATVITAAQRLSTELESVIMAFQDKAEAREFMVKLATAQTALKEFLETEAKEGAPVERMGAYTKERVKVEDNITTYLDQLKEELKSEGEIHPELDMLVMRLNECRDSLVHSEEAVVNFFQDETELIQKSFEQLTKLESAIDDVFKALVPSAILRTIEKLFGSAGDTLLHRTGNVNP
jgi:ABC-type transporter Mla subunit MlaD